MKIKGKFTMWISGNKVDKLLRVLEHVSETVKILEHLMASIKDELVAMEAEVAKLTTVTESVVALLVKLSGLLVENAEAPAKVREIAATIKSRADQIQAAVLANTPVEPVPPVEPPTPPDVEV